MVQDHVGAIPWKFESSLRHQRKKCLAPFIEKAVNGALAFMCKSMCKLPPVLPYDNSKGNKHLYDFPSVELFSSKDVTF